MLSVGSTSGDFRGGHGSYFKSSNPGIPLSDIQADRSNGPQAGKT